MIPEIQAKVNDTFTNAFGRTPLRQRLEDILGEAMELYRYTDLANLREEAGDLLASTIQLCNECGWSLNSLLEENIKKIEGRVVQYRTLGRKIKVAILGGAFDPIHQGHLALAQFVLNTSKTFDEVWVVPCYSHMHGKKMEPPEDRLEMCRLAAKVDGRIRIFDYEILHKLKGETYHFLKQLLSEQFAKDEVDFSYIIGLDNANTFDSWVNYQDLERMMRFVVVERQGMAPDPKVDWYLKPPHIYLRNPGTIPLISSTEIRKNLKYLDYDAVRDFLSPEVIEYIQDKDLYREID